MENFGGEYRNRTGLHGFANILLRNMSLIYNDKLT